MVAAKELRIGNYVYWQPIRIIPANFICKEIVQMGDIDHSAFPDDIAENQYCAIPLTEQWLEKFGFLEEFRGEYTIKYTDKKHNEIGFDWNKSFKWQFRFYDKHIKCEYVHQLQNLYFALIGTELELTQ